MPELRPVAARDLARVLRIERDCFPNPWPPSAFALALAAPDLLFLGIGENLLGYVIAAIDDDEVLVANLAVASEARRQGAGTALLDAAIDWARSRGATRCRLDVRRSNAAAIALYERHGFRVVGEQPGYYTSPPEDALIMRLELASTDA